MVILFFHINNAFGIKCQQLKHNYNIHGASISLKICPMDGMRQELAISLQPLKLRDSGLFGSFLYG